MDKPCRSDLDIAGGGASPLSAILRDPSGNPVDTQVMTRGNDNVYTANVSFNGNALNYSPSCYTLDVELGDGYQKDVFHPIAEKTDALNICLMQAFQVNWILKNPVETQNYPIHDPLTFFGSPKGLTLQYRCSRGKTPSRQPTQSKGKTLSSREGCRWMAFKRLMSNFKPDNSGLFTANWPANLTTSGKYTL